MKFLYFSLKFSFFLYIFLLKNYLFLYFYIPINNEQHSNSRGKSLSCLSLKTGEVYPQNHTSYFFKSGRGLSHKRLEKTFVLWGFSQNNKFKIGQQAFSFPQERITQFVIAVSGTLGIFTLLRTQSCSTYSMNFAK